MPVSLQENCAILKELVSLRAQKSRLLGFHTHADYVLEMNMAKTSQAVATFLGSHSTLGQSLQPCAAASTHAGPGRAAGSLSWSPGALDGDVARPCVGCGWVSPSFLGSRAGGG